MTEIQGQAGLVAVITVICLASVCSLCLCCKRRSIVRENNALYDRDSNQENQFLDGKQHNSGTGIRQPRQTHSTSRKSTDSTNTTANRVHCSYQNIANSSGIYEPAYVDPIPHPLYVNNEDVDLCQDQGEYENIFPTNSVQQSAEDEYANTSAMEEGSDYVNTCVVQVDHFESG